MTDHEGTLPPRAGEYVAMNYDATPDEVLDVLDLDESHRKQVERLCARTRYGIFRDREANDDVGLQYDRVEWNDVADWDVSPQE